MPNIFQELIDKAVGLLDNKTIDNNNSHVVLYLGILNSLLLIIIAQYVIRDRNRKPADAPLPANPTQAQRDLTQLLQVAQQGMGLQAQRAVAQSASGNPIPPTISSQRPSTLSLQTRRRNAAAATANQPGATIPPNLAVNPPFYGLTVNELFECYKSLFALIKSKYHYDGELVVEPLIENHKVHHDQIILKHESGNIPQVIKGDFAITTQRVALYRKKELPVNPNEKQAVNTYYNYISKGKRTDKVQGGSEIANYSLAFAGAGTLGAILEDVNNVNTYYGLTNAHVLAGSQGGHTVEQPAGLKQKDNIIGTVLTTIPEDTNKIPFSQDYTVIRIDTTKRQPSSFLMDGKTQIFGSVVAEPGMIVKKFGRTTGLTQARVLGITNQNGIVMRPTQECLDAGLDIEISESGDSGSIWLTDTHPAYAIGLNALGENNTTHPGLDYEIAIAIPIDHVLKGLEELLKTPNQAKPKLKFYRELIPQADVQLQKADQSIDFAKEFMKYSDRLSLHDPMMKDIEKKYGNNTFLAAKRLLKGTSAAAHGVDYYIKLRKQGYTEGESIEAALAGVVGYTRTKHMGTSILVLAGETATVGIGEIASGVGVLPGIATIFLSAVGGGIGFFGKKKAGEIGELTAFSYAYYMKKFRKPKTSNKVIGIVTKDSTSTDKYSLIKIEDALAGTTEQKKNYKTQFETAQAHNTYSTPAQKRAINNNFQRQLETGRFVTETLGIPYLSVDAATIEFLNDPASIIRKQPNKLMVEQKDQGFQYIFPLIDPKNTLGIDAPNSEKALKVREHTAKNGGLLTEEGMFNPHFGRPINLSTKTVEEDEDDLTENIISLSEQDILTLIDHATASQKEAFKKAYPKSDVKKAAVALKEFFKNDDRREAVREELQSYAGIVVTFGEFIGNPKIVEYGQVGSNLINLGISAGAMLSGVITPQTVGMFFTSLLNLKNHFRKKQQPDPFAIIFQELMQISQQLQEIKELIIQNTLLIDQHLDIIFEEMLKNFNQLLVETYISRQLIMRKLEYIQTSIYQLSIQLNRQIHGLWMQDLIGANFLVRDYKIRYGNTTVRDAIQFNTIADTLTTWLLETASHTNSTAQHLYYNDCPEGHILAIITSSKPDDIHNIVGLLLAYATYSLNISFPENHMKVINPHVWLMALMTYKDLLAQGSKELLTSRDPKLNECKEILLAGGQIMNLYFMLRQNPALFDTLLVNYSNSLMQVRETFASIMLYQQISKGKVNVAAFLQKQKEIIQRFQTMPIACRADFPFKNHENNSVKYRMDDWNNKIAGAAIPQFMSEYFSILLDDYATKHHQPHALAEQPIALFFEVTVSPGDEYIIPTVLLPISVLFKDPTKCHLPEKLVYAERLGLGEFNYAISKFTTVYDTSVEANIEIKIVFKRTQGDTLDVAIVSLATQSCHEVVHQIQMLSTIDSKYGQETGNPYQKNARKTLNLIAYLSNWLNATVIEAGYKNLYHEDVAFVRDIDAKLKTSEADVFENVTNKLSGSYAPSSSPEEEIEFDAFKKSLEIHELHYQLLLIFSRLVGWSQATINKIEKLWDRNYLIDFLKNQRIHSNPSVQNFYDAVEQHLNVSEIAKKIDGTSMLRNDIPYYEILQLLAQIVEEAQSVTTTHRSKIELLVESALTAFIEQLAELGLELDDQFYNEYACYTKDSFNGQYTLTPAIQKIILQAYTENDIDRGLKYTFRANKNLYIFTPFNASGFLSYQTTIAKQYLEHDLKAIAKFCETKNNIAIMPFYFEIEIANLKSKQKLWVFLKFSKNDVTNSLDIYFVDPTGNYSKEQGAIVNYLGTEVDVENTSSRKETLDFLKELQVILTNLKINSPIQLNNLPQLSQKNNWQDSGCFLIYNAYTLLSGKPLSIVNIESCRNVCTKLFDTMKSEQWSLPAEEDDLYDLIFSRDELIEKLPTVPQLTEKVSFYKNQVSAIEQHKKFFMYATEAPKPATAPALKVVEINTLQL